MPRRAASATLKHMYDDDDDLRDLDARRRPAFKFIVIVLIAGLLLFIAPLFFNLILN